MVGVQRPPKLRGSVHQASKDPVVEFKKNRWEGGLSVKRVVARREIQRLPRVENVAIPIEEGVPPGEPDEVRPVFIHFAGNFAETWVASQIRMWIRQSG